MKMRQLSVSAGFARLLLSSSFKVGVVAVDATVSCDFDADCD
jgi:hypothetical protein